MRYKITFKLDTPVSIDLPAFDAIIGALTAQKIYDGVVIQKINYSQEEQNAVISKIPISQHQSGAFLASKAIAEFSGINYEEVIHKHFPQAYVHRIDFEGKTRKLNTGAGEFKAAVVPFTCTSVSEISYVFETDKITELKELLNDYLFAIGKKHNKGKGLVKSYHIIETDSPLIKYMPLYVITEFGLKVVEDKRLCIGWKPPYWLPDNIELCKSAEL